MHDEVDNYLNLKEKPVIPVALQSALGWQPAAVSE
jgi:hypothetical protein